MEETSRMDQYKLWGTLLSIYAYEKSTTGLPLPFPICSKIRRKMRPYR